MGLAARAVVARIIPSAVIIGSVLQIRETATLGTGREMNGAIALAIVNVLLVAAQDLQMSVKLLLSLPAA